MSSYAQPQAFSPTHSSLHFPLSSPPLHIPPSLQSLETPSSGGFVYARRARTRNSDASVSTFEGSRRESMSSMESVPALSRRISQPNQEHKGLTRQPSIRGRQPSHPSLLRRSPSSFALALEAHHLPQLSRTNSVSTTCSTSSNQVTTPPYSTHDSFQVVSEEGEDFEDGTFLEPFPPKTSRSSVQPHVSTAPAPLKRPGLTRRDTPIPPRQLSLHTSKPSKSFTTSLETQLPAPTPIPAPQSREKRPPIQRRDTPHPMFDPHVQTISAGSKMPNFISASIRQSLTISQRRSPPPVQLPQAPVLSPVLAPSPVSFASYACSPRGMPFLGGMSPESLADDGFWLDGEEGEVVVGSPSPVRKFSSVLDGKVWVGLGV